MRKKIRLSIILIVILIFTIFIVLKNLRNEVQIEYLGEVVYPDSLDSFKNYLLEFGYKIENHQANPCFVISKSTKEWHENRWKICIPGIDFSKNYLYLSRNRKIKSIEYIRFTKSKYTNCHSGKIIYDDKYVPERIYIYKTDKILVKNSKFSDVHVIPKK